MPTVLLAALALAMAPPRFEPRPCADAALAGTRCGVVGVPEDRERPEGRQIGLNVVIVPAVSATPDLPALVDLDGGPGLPATRSAGFYLADGVAYRARRDVVLVDQRGTGGSNPLTCDGFTAHDAAYGAAWPVELVDDCRRTLEPRADLTQYGTRDAVEDLDAVRVALGQPQLDIVALSYGTTLALRYLAAYPQRVRAAVLLGVAPPDAMPPRDHAVVAERALDQLFADCAADRACHAAFPDLPTDLAQAMERLRKPGALLSPEVFAERLRTMMYVPTGARRIPRIVHAAASGDLAPFQAATQGPDGTGGRIAEGVYLSITCGESFALMDYPRAAQAARATRFGDYRLRRQREACARWPVGRTAADHLTPVTAPVAALLISGGRDPVTPPDWADAVAKAMPRARRLSIPWSGHIFNGLSGVDTCYDPLAVKFLETADPVAVDATCLADMQPPPFVTTP